MDNAGYVALSRQSGLEGEMRAIANNIANMSTTGFRKEGVIFSEFVRGLDRGDASLSIARAAGRSIDLTQGVLAQTGGVYDFAIEGEGFFMIAAPSGNELTRSGAFTLAPDGGIVTAEGFPVLDQGSAPLQIDPARGPIAVSPDGTVSQGGQPVAQLGLFAPASPGDLRHTTGTRFSAGPEPQPAQGARVFQGFLEGSNVNPVEEIARMIEVQRAYEMGQGFLDREDQRIRAVLQSMAR
ncbi:MAG: flagellar hook-basal body complex protein [Paracoccaceae bacterium]